MWGGLAGEASHGLLGKFGILRVSPKTELKGFDLVKQGQNTYASFLFFSNTLIDQACGGGCFAAPSRFSATQDAAVVAPNR